MRPRKRPSRLAKTCVALGLLTVGLTNAVAVGQAAALPDEPVRLMMIYDRDTDDHYFGVTITLPAGRPHTISESGHQEPGGSSITWDVVLNPALRNVCKVGVRAGFCEFT